MEGGEMVRALLQHFFVTEPSFGKLTGLVECPRPCEHVRNVVTFPICRRCAGSDLLSQAHLMISFCRKRPACRAGPGLQWDGTAVGSASPTPVNKLSTILGALALRPPHPEEGASTCDSGKRNPHEAP